MTPAILNAPELLAMLREVAEIMKPAGYNASAAIVLPEEQCGTVEEVAKLAGVEVKTHSAGASDEEPYTIVAVVTNTDPDVRVQSHRHSTPPSQISRGGGQ